MEKILIADDEQLMRQLVIDFLKPEGYEILEASDGKEAWIFMIKNTRTSSSWTS